MTNAEMIPTAPAIDPRLEEMLGTFLLVTAVKTPGECRVRDAAIAFNRWALSQPVERLADAYEHLIHGQLIPEWGELERDRPK